MAMNPGRARGRARGRGDGEAGIAAPGPAEDAPMPRGGVQPRGGAHTDFASRMERMQERRERMIASLVVPDTKPQNVTTTIGSSGSPVDLVSNFYRIQGGPNWCMYEYHIDFEPEIDFMSLRGALVRAHKDKIGEIYTFNGSNLISPKQMPEEQTWTSKRDSDDATITLRVRRTAEVPPDSPEATRILDIVIRNMQKALKLKQSKRDFFDPECEQRMPNHGLAVWPGYAMTIMKYENELLLNMDVIHRVMRTDTCLELMNGIMQEARQNRMDSKEAIVQALVNQVVLTKYNNKTHTIADVLWPPENTPLWKFDKKGEEISIKDYMRVQYGIEIKVDNQPLLVTRPRKMARRLNEEGRVDKLVPELCYLTGLTDAQRSNFKLMKEFGEITRLNPTNRLKKYQDFGRRVTQCPEASQMLSGWNLRLDANPLKIKGRVLPPVELGTGGRPIKPDPRTAEWDRDVKNFQALDPSALKNWVLIYPQRDEAMAREFASSMARVAQGMGIEASQPKPLAIGNIRADGYKQACQQAASLQGCRLIVCLLVRKDRNIYETIKRFTLVDAGIPSQCCCINTLRKGMMSVCSKIMQQVCVKLGGALWKVAIPCKKTMICGFDTYHHAKYQGQSVGGFVATVNDTFTKFYSRSFQHDVRGELSPYLKNSMAEAIKTFATLNGGPPDIILFYRDGVADNQLKAVADVEVSQLIDVWKNFGTDYHPKMSVIVVQKRIRPRFFALQGPNVANPIPGTVVDNTITNPRSYDFYVISQAVRQGTVTPTRYNIIHESTNLKPDHHHQLAFRLSHLYYNWPGTIRVVAPCHYAHKLAFLVGQYVLVDTNRNLWDKLYYL